MTPEKKAEQELDLLLEQFPHLRHRFDPEDEESPTDEPPDPEA